MTAPIPHLQKFSDDLETKEILGYMVILYQITKNRDVFELSRFVKLVAKVIGPEDFNKMVRRIVRMMGDSKCGEDLCSDWIMTQLFELYSALGTK